MIPNHDPELDDVLQDEKLQHIAALLSSAKVPEPPLDDAFRTGLRRQLMQQAWAMAEGRDAWWRRAFAPPGLAWAGAAAGLVLIASVIVFMATQAPGGLTRVVVNSPMDGSKTVALQQPILVSFNQPMDHPSTEAAVLITPATNVTFAWQQNTLAVQPTSGNLAPNTQYQVTIGPTAKTASGQPLAAPQTITFVTQPPTPPTPAPPTSRPTPPGNALSGEKQLTTPAMLASGPIQWSADSSTIYFIDANQALRIVPAKGGEVTIVAPSGASSPAVSPAGDRLAYIRAGRIEVLTFASGTTTELAVSPSPALVGWAKDKLVWATADGVYTQGTSNPALLAPLPTTGAVLVLSFAPDGAHAAYSQDQKLFLLDLASGKSTALGQAGARFAGWSFGGGYVLYSSSEGTVVIADMQGNATSTLTGGEPSWSTQDAILLGGDTDLYQVRPDGTALTKLANGTYHTPLWAPNGSTFAYFRGGSIWVATAPALPPAPTALDLAAAAVNAFMQARLKGQLDQAATFLDDSGKQAYAAGGLSLTINGDPQFSRFYILTQEMTGTQPDTARFVVRLVLSHGKIDVSEFDETLTLVRDTTAKQFLVDQATASVRRELGKGAEVVSVDITADTIKVTFDSDLDPGTLPDGVFIIDSKGKKVDATAAYANRVVTLSGLDLKPAGKYRLVVLPTVRDVQGRNVAAEYDLDLLGPALKSHTDHKQASSGAPSPTPVPSPTD